MDAANTLGTYAQLNGMPTGIEIFQNVCHPTQPNIVEEEKETTEELKHIVRCSACMATADKNGRVDLKARGADPGPFQEVDSPAVSVAGSAVFFFPAPSVP